MNARTARRVAALAQTAAVAVDTLADASVASRYDGTQSIAHEIKAHMDAQKALTAALNAVPASGQSWDGLAAISACQTLASRLLNTIGQPGTLLNDVRDAAGALAAEAHWLDQSINAARIDSATAALVAANID